MAKANDKDKESRDQHHEDSIPTSPMPSSGSVGPGTQIDHFRVDHELGRGGAGVVYLAHDTRLGRRVAIKMLPPEVVNNPEVLHRWKREARLLASLNHPNIATIHEELEETEGVSYLVLEYVEGETLRERIARGEIPVEEAISIALQIVEAISAAHGKGVVHRDLKPANIKITPEGRVKVLDFGIAKILGDRKLNQLGTIVTQPGQVIGTPGYMSPEQSLGKETDHRTDIWSFGCVLFEMLASQRPFPGRETSEVLEAMLQHEPIWESLPKEVELPLRGILRKCLAKDPEKRYQSSSELHKDLSEYYNTLTAPAQKLRSIFVLFRKPRVAIPTVFILVILCTLSIWLVHKSSKVRWARTIMLPQAIKLGEDGEYLAAFFTAHEVEKYIPNDPMLLRLWPDISREYSIVTTPPGADIYFREYSKMNSDWNYLKRSPIENIQFPRGIYRWKITKDGFEDREFVADGQTINVELWEEGSFPSGMVRILPGRVRLDLWPFLRREEAVEVPSYWIDQYEVTNEQYKRFVDNGGYEKQEWWKHKFIKDGRELSWGQAIKEFRDKTGRPGPSIWEGGTYSKGKEKFPVSGVSWYEAVAYAEFVGKCLPTIYHWQKAACIGQAAVIVPLSNFDRKGPAPVGSFPGIGRTGLYDMAGNVKEWCWNIADISGDHRYILGGGWGEQTYMFFHVDTRSPWDRSLANGFRCVQYLTNEKATVGTLSLPVTPPPVRDYSKETPVSDETFNSWLKNFYSYDRTELNAVVEKSDENSDYWRKEKVTFNAAYGGEHMIAYLFLPKNVKPPYQTVIYFPGISAVNAPSFEGLPQKAVTEFVIMSGRALVYPVYKGTYERKFVGKRPKEPEKEPIAYRDWIIQLSKDLKRTIDYLETRTDIDNNKIVYYGMSWGAWLGPIMLAVEERIGSGIILVGGLPPWKVASAADPINFAPRIKVPVLIISGEHDFMFPIETFARPLLEFLGSTDKELKTYEGGHGNIMVLFSRQIRGDILDWLDKYLGPVD